ncbi:CHAT domain-containing protein [Rubrivivax sp. A210]|uniref:CHAT domain-containing protein n=1 Tax=Rubrivivax sp. A210 TaxID=2772301 RepID=UPI00191AC1AE|nr:CHAT domain-containing tetratricopeptide repeat protein [Rubrivivax sp. A210]CAD5374301.1 CHAT domain-containing protein [Rubrivivax sp. A210]
MATAAVAAQDCLAVAWALKDLCYEAWSSEPPRAARAAEALRGLASSGVPEADALEIEGLARWTEGIACLTRGQMIAGVQALDDAAAALRQAGKPDPAAQTQIPKIMALSMLGHHKAAAACARVAQRELLALGNLRAASRVSLNLGGLLERQDEYADAADIFREAAVLFARLGDHEHSVLADIGLAGQLASMGDFDEAMRIYARARMRSENRGLSLQLALVDESVALVELARGRYRPALAAFESARRRYEALAVPQYLAIAEKQLADAYLELRLLPEALAHFDTAVERFAGLDLPDEQAWALVQRGRTQALLGQPAPAAASFASAATLFEAQRNAVGRSAVTLARAELALARGDAPAALEWASQAEHGYAQAEQADGRARAAVAHAQALLQMGQVIAAQSLFEATLATARANQQVQVQVRCLTGLGLSAQAAGQADEARAAFEAAIELFEDQRRTLPGDDLRSAFLADHLRPYQERLRMAVAAGEGGEALAQLDRFRARALDERLAEGVEPTLQAEVQPLRDRLNWLYRRVQQQQDEALVSVTLNQELLRTEQDLLERARRHRLAAPALAGGAQQGFGVAALQAALQEGDALVEYGVLDGELFACVATQHAVVLVRGLAPWVEVAEAVRGVRFQLETLRHGVAPILQHMDRLMQRLQLRLVQLHALIWSPLLPALANANRVLIVPHGQLGALPFAALGDGVTTLVERHEIALVPSARAALRGLQRPPVTPHRALALGESSRLPHAAGEARGVAAHFDLGLSLVGEQATLQQLQAHAGQADVLHLACHAQFRSDNPRFSALHLHDGALTVDQAEALGLKPCTVVLSACETGLAEQDTGDEMVGLVRAFLVAGASRVLASLWPVDDQLTAAFMARFYGALRQGQCPAQALRSAQLATRAEHPHPYMWSAFVLYGGW